VNWPLVGIASGLTRLRELEHLARGWGRVSRDDPDRELPDVELSDHERQAALDREAARRFWER